MNSIKPSLPEIPEKERTPLVDAMLELIEWQDQRIDMLEQELLKLKGETTKPDIKPSKMDKSENQQDSDSDKSDSNTGQSEKPKPGPKRKKTASLTIHRTLPVEPETIPQGSVFKGYREVVIQDIKLESFNTCYRLAQYQTPDGQYISGQLPAHLNGKHFDTTLVSFILHQYHHQHVTQPLLLAHLHEIGVDISAGQLSKLLTEEIDLFHQEKKELFQAGLQVSDTLQTDDTLARHAGKNGYCTFIGNELFAWFSSTESKSRINFLQLLSQRVEQRYVLNDGALAYMEQHKLPKFVLAQLDAMTLEIKSTEAWQQWLDSQGIMGKTHRRIITEGALMGSLLAQGIPVDLNIVSDDAGQFNVFDHALCWIHAERGINRLLPVNVLQEKAVDWARNEIWSIYAELKNYKLSPSSEQALAIKQRFEALCSQDTDYATLNQVLKRLGENQHELLRVLDKPHLPLHNNLSERDIRDYVKKRKISGSTRSEAGRQARDTFASLKKTCLKHGISFWAYLKDRLGNAQKIPRLSELIFNAATCH